MAYLTQHFVWTRSHDSGSEGWIPECMKNAEVFIPGNGLIVAHDLLEHFNASEDGEEECMAHGSILYMRIQTGRLRPDGNDFGTRDEDVLGSGIAEIYHDTEGKTLRRIRMPVSKHLMVDDGWKEECLRYFLRDVRGEDFAEGVSQADLIAWFNDAWNWLLRGYLKAVRRWEGRGSLKMAYPQYSAADMFWLIAQEVDKYHGDQADVQEGERMSIHVNCLRRSYNIVRRTAYEVY